MKLINNIDQTIFREYDIRGIYGNEITEDMAYTLGKGFGSFIQEKGLKKAIIGYDNRESSPILADALIRGISETGVDVTNIGLVTTPMYYFARINYGFVAGIMITASHNPKEYNGFKLAYHEIGNAYGKYITDLRDFINESKYIDGNGTINNIDIKNDYINLIKNSLHFGDKKIKAVVDCGNGTGSVIIKDIFDALNIEYYPLYCESDSDFPNHHPDPSVAKNMVDLQKKVLELKYDLGIGIDGDADRVGIVDENGNIIGADLFMIIIYRYLSDKISDKRALFDVKCSKSLTDELDRLGYAKTMYRTGNSYMNMMMQTGNFKFGGELSGHVYFKDKFPGFDDGIYAGLRLIEILSNNNKTVSQLLENINKYFSTNELKFATTDEEKFNIVNKVKEYCEEKGYNIIDIDGVRAEFTDGWALVRASNTGPNITARFEANTENRLKDIEEEFTSLLNSLIK